MGIVFISLATYIGCNGNGSPQDSGPGDNEVTLLGTSPSEWTVTLVRDSLDRPCDSQYVTSHDITKILSGSTFTIRARSHACSTSLGETCDGERATAELASSARLDFRPFASARAQFRVSLHSRSHILYPSGGCLYGYTTGAVRVFVESNVPGSPGLVLYERTEFYAPRRPPCESVVSVSDTVNVSLANALTFSEATLTMSVDVLSGCTLRDGLGHTYDSEAWLEIHDFRIVGER